MTNHAAAAEIDATRTGIEPPTAVRSPLSEEYRYGGFDHTLLRYCVDVLTYDTDMREWSWSLHSEHATEDDARAALRRLEGE